MDWHDAPTTSIATDGVGITRAHLFDRRGALGEALQSLFVEARPAV